MRHAIVGHVRVRWIWPVVVIATMMICNVSFGHKRRNGDMERFPEELQEFLKNHGVTQKDLDIWGSDTVDAIWIKTVKQTIVDALKERKEWNDGYKRWMKEKGIKDVRKVVDE